MVLTGDAENIEKFNRRLVKVTKQHNEECKQLLKLMGIPYVDVSYFIYPIALYKGGIGIKNFLILHCS